MLFPAREREYVDIDTMNKIAQINDNFKEFLKRVKIDVSSKEIRKEKYDKIYSLEQLEKKG
ncbi:MAG TPA: hypothetical protein PLI27_10040 [Ignavibacteriales bacterium]|nr:hypothetical protein [Ignavibacteriales bacterium]HOL82246.1 hypothetical protein [Ignavibacteriales bacterium]HOM66272.1 hypothetical protein [Ignavibacteriales bacterium]HPD68402.1 hypothetical protein [Ignavibacteriales bacterium]HPP34406.1 hypothetical protein [Ignavibacteriales bacterium]